MTKKLLATTGYQQTWKENDNYMASYKFLKDQVHPLDNKNFPPVNRKLELKDEKHDAWASCEFRRYIE